MYVAYKGFAPERTPSILEITLSATFVALMIFSSRGCLIFSNIGNHTTFSVILVEYAAGSVQKVTYL
jgi:hypothetical protein